jgi:hypothetical protein
LASQAATKWALAPGVCFLCSTLLFEEAKIKRSKPLKKPVPRSTFAFWAKNPCQAPNHIKPPEIINMQLAKNLFKPDILLIGENKTGSDWEFGNANHKPLFCKTLP